MKSNREKILESLGVTRQATIQKLAEQLEINPITVRHHLLRMQDEGLVTSNEKRNGVGRPHLVFQLTNHGRQRISTNYHQLVKNLLESVQTLFGRQASSELLVAVGQEMAKSYALEINEENLPETMNSFCDMMANEGFQIEWEHKDNRVIIRNTSCPYYNLENSNREICLLDQSFFSTLLGKNLELEQFTVETDSNCSHCVYSFEL